MISPCGKVQFTVRTVVPARKIVCNAFEVLRNVNFRLRVLSISERVCARVD